MANSLHDWQTRFLEACRGGGGADELFAEPARGLSAGARFDVYRTGYWLRASESLVDDFPLTRRLLGSARFECAMRDFLAVRAGHELELGELSPKFYEFLSGASPPVARALRLDLLAVEARRSAEPEPVRGGGYGLHPSARFYRDGKHAYALWRLDGSVVRERIDERTLRLLEAFREPAGLEALGERLEEFAGAPSFVQDSVAAWTECGLICAYPER